MATMGPSSTPPCGDNNRRCDPGLCFSNVALNDSNDLTSSHVLSGFKMQALAEECHARSEMRYVTTQVQKRFLNIKSCQIG